MSGTNRMRLIDAAVAILVIAAAARFGLGALQGGSGLGVALAAETELARKEAELAALRSERARLENLTLRLSDSHLDLDLLDERARDLLGRARADEIVIR